MKSFKEFKNQNTLHIEQDTKYIWPKELGGVGGYESVKYVLNCPVQTAKELLKKYISDNDKLRLYFKNQSINDFYKDIAKITFSPSVKGHTTVIFKENNSKKVIPNEFGLDRIMTELKNYCNNK